MNKIYDDVYLNKLCFKYEDPTKYISFNKYYDSKELFNEIKYLNIKLDDAAKNQKELLNKINEVDIGRKYSEQKQVISNLKKL